METAVLNPRAVFDCICGFSSNCDRKGQQYPVEYYLELVEGYSEGKIHKSETELVNGNVNTVYFVNQARGNTLLNLRVYGNWRCHATQSSIRLAWTLSLKYLSVKPWLLMKKRFVFRG